MKFVLASHNPKKLDEMRTILWDLGIDVLAPAEAGFLSEVAETGATFEENALLKARAACAETGLPAIADDSGLCVVALGGAPGIYSARYGGEGLTDRDRTALLLRNLENEEQRAAKFVSSIVCAFPEGAVITAGGECAGEILREMRGTGGFGYDPVFFLPELGRTMAELAPDEKNAVSHRGRAIRKFKTELGQYVLHRGKESLC